MIEWYWALLFFVSLACNGRAAFKLLVDWKGMLTTCRLIEDAYEGLDALPEEAALERDARAPVFVHLVPAFHEPDIGVTLKALLDSRYPHGKLHVVVAVKEEEERAPHPTMGVATGGSRAYEGVTLSLANFARLDVRGRTCAIQQSSIFIRVSIARLINEARRIAWFGRLAARAPGVARLLRPLFDLGFRRSQICL